MTIEIFEDADGEYRARIKAANSKTLFVTSEGYQNRADCYKAVELLQANAATATIYEV